MGHCYARCDAQPQNKHIKGTPMSNDAHRTRSFMNYGNFLHSTIVLAFCIDSPVWFVVAVGNSGFAISPLEAFHRVSIGHYLLFIMWEKLENIRNIANIVQIVEESLYLCGTNSV